MCRWNMFEIGTVCLFEKYVFLKHVSNWHCENFVISKPYVKCKVLKHKILRIDTKSTTNFFFFSVLNVGLFKMQWLIDGVRNIFWNSSRWHTAWRRLYLLYDSMHKYIIKTIPLVSKNNNVWFFVKILLKMTPVYVYGSNCEFKWSGKYMKIMSLFVHVSVGDVLGLVRMEKW